MQDRKTCASWSWFIGHGEVPMSIPTVDGEDPAPVGMVKTLLLVGYSYTVSIDARSCSSNMR